MSHIIGKKQGKIAIAYVHGGSVKNLTVRSINQFVLHDGGPHGRRLLEDLADFGGLYVQYNRNVIAQGFLESDAEWLLSLDTDIHMLPETPYRLLDTANAIGAKFLSALYVGNLHHVIVDGKPTLRQSPVWLNEKPSGMYQNVGHLEGKPQRIGAVGMGCCLIHREVFEAFPERYPDKPGDLLKWFDCEQRWIDGKWNFFGEDVVFCDRYRHWCGGEIWGDSSIVVGHLKESLLTADTMVAEIQRETIQRPTRIAL